MSFAACRGAAPAPSPAPSASSVQGVTTPAPTGRLSELKQAELSRRVSAVTAEELSSREPGLRRAAARTLARAATPKQRDALLRLLHDEDPEVLTWAAFGLQKVCEPGEPTVARALVSRVVALELSAEPAQRAPSLVETFARTLGHCEGPEAEETLRAWLTQPEPWRHSAALGLANLAGARHQLADVTLVSLLDAVAADPPLVEALLPLASLRAVEGAVATRLIEVARPRAHASGTEARFGVLALAAAGPTALDALGEVLLDEQASVAARAEAARQLARLANEGRSRLAQLAAQLLPHPSVDDPRLTNAQWAVLSSVMDGLQPPLQAALLEPLKALASLPLADSQPALLQRRVVHLRCRAADLLAGAASKSRWLEDCDPAHGVQGKLAELRVLARRELKASRLRRAQQLATEGEPLVRMRALELLATAGEVNGSWAIWKQALGADSPGVVATAARTLAGRPELGGAKASETEVPHPHPELIAALQAAFAKDRGPDSAAVRSALIDAAGALQVLSLRAAVLQACKSPQRALREHAASALQRLGEIEGGCGVVEGPALEFSQPPDKVTLEVTTDAGPLTLEVDSTSAPAAAARLLELVASHYYDGLVVHRVVPGLIVQFGDRGADGYGGASLPSLPSELGPQPFVGRDLGVALAGPDTGGAQLFVTLAPYPELTGEYPWLGRAGAGWELLAEGDRIERVTVRP